MHRKFEILLLSALLSVATGCSHNKAAAPASGRLLNSVMVFAGSPQRYIAERHKLEVITSESELQKSWESAVAFCGTLQCEVVSSSITTKVGDSTPSGVVSLRVVPDDFQKLVAYVEKLGTIAQHTTEREDKTTAVIDTEAKIKNLTSFRDNLRAMLGRPSAKVADLVEIQKQLTDTQAELDSETTQRKLLANETEKIAVEISFRVERNRGGGGGFGPVWNALRESGSILADSTASLIETIVAIIPWLILVVPAAWLLLKAWRILKRRRNRPTSPPPSTTST
jgi:Domain of unknown function (DUF4349)